jgi:hypothetical protein
LGTLRRMKRERTGLEKKLGPASVGREEAEEGLGGLRLSMAEEGGGFDRRGTVLSPVSANSETEIR